MFQSCRKLHSLYYTIANPFISGSRGKVVFIQIGNFMHTSGRIFVSDFNDTNEQRFVYNLFTISSYYSCT